ncbi:MAG: M48 family metallopeptidase [Alphaproteobacteria bacterium]|nr:M48 family metallopeptidase [Alphaproteobacteria bacterium]
MRQRRTLDSELLSLGERRVDLAIRVNPRARRISLKLDPASGQVVLVLPSARARRRGLEFARGHGEWILAELAKLSPRIGFEDGARIPYLDRPHTIRHVGGRGTVERRADEIHVAGAPEHTPRRVADWLRQEARRLLTDGAFAKAEAIGARPGRITIRDPRTRWGSCAASGALSFSWRLVLAPESVLDYVVAHEVAHLREAHHGPAFWALARRLHADVDTSRAWLKVNGAGLHRYG